MMRKLISVFLLIVIIYVAFYPSLMDSSINVKLVFNPITETQQFYIYFDELKMHRARAFNESGWFLINFDKRPIDIASSKNYVYLLAEGSSVPTGKYDRVSLSIKESSLKIGETLIKLKVPGDQILIQEDFTILKESPKNLTIIFKIDMEKTITLNELVYEAKLLELK